MAVTLAGCSGDGGDGGGGGGDGGGGGGDGGDGGGDGGDGGSTSEPSSLKVGFVLSFSGPFASAGEQLVDGFKLKIEEELGGEIDGHPVEYVQKDTATDPSQAASATNEMIQQEEVDFLVGPVASSSADAMLSVASRFEGEFVWLSPSAGSTALTEACNNSFIRTSWNNWQLGKPFGEWVHENVGESAYVFATDYAAGDQIGGYFQEGFEEAGGSIEGVARPPLGNSDWSSFMQNARDSGAEVLFAFTSGTDEVGLVKSFTDLGLRDAGMSLTASATIATQDNLEAYGEAGIGIKGIATYSPSKETDANTAFREAHLEAYDYLPQFWGANAYDAATVLTAGVTQGGIAPDEFIPTVEGYQWESPRGTMSISEKTHDPIFDLTVDEVVALEGEPTPIQPHGSGVTSSAIDVLEQVEAPAFGCDLSQ